MSSAVSVRSVSVEASNRLSQKELARLFSARELRAIMKRVHPHEGLAARLAAKRSMEDIFLGLGFSHVPYKEFEIINGRQGEPLLSVRKGPLRKIMRANFKKCMLSLTHTRLWATACIFVSFR